MTYNTKDIRNIVLIGHGYSGKTSLNEAILFTGHSTPVLGKVDSGKSVSDYTEQEIAKKMSIKLSLSYTEWNNTLINIIDTPGAADFVGEVVAANRASDCAVFVLNGEAGVEIETIKNWRRCDLPKLVFINKMNKENSDYEKCLASLKENFKDKNFVPLTIPIGSGKDFKGIVDLIDKEARYFEDEGKKIRKEKAPDNITGLDQHFTEMLETAVESDEELMNKYFDGQKISHDEIIKGLKLSILSGTIVPVICGDSMSNSGTAILLDSIVNYMPSPSDVGPIKAQDNSGKDIEIQPDSSKPASIFIFKTTIDQFAGKISYFRVRSGQIKNDIELFNTKKNQKQKCGKLYKVFGKNLKDVNSLNAGDIGAFVKLESVSTNDTLAESSFSVIIPPLDLPQPVYSQAIECPNKKDEEKLITLLQKISEEDPTFKIEFNKETKQNIISGMGETQIKLILSNIKEKNKIETHLFDQKVAYRETIRKKATAEYQHKKQSGGAGQYAKIAIDIYPIEEGKQYEFVNAIVGGAISKGFIPACEKGFHEAMEEGCLAGNKVVDVGIRLFDGKEHPVDSKEIAFKTAARQGFKEAMKQASPVLLEPIMELSVYADQKYVGDILSDLSSKRGRVTGQDSLGGGIELIKALVPQKELLRYSIDLKSITSGTGSFEIQFHNYQALTGKLADEVIANAQKAKEEQD